MVVDIRELDLYGWLTDKALVYFLRCHGSIPDASSVRLLALRSRKESASLQVPMTANSVYVCLFICLPVSVCILSRVLSLAVSFLSATPPLPTSFLNSLNHSFLFPQGSLLPLPHTFAESRSLFPPSHSYSHPSSLNSPSPTFPSHATACIPSHHSLSRPSALLLHLLHL